MCEMISAWLNTHWPSTIYFFQYGGLCLRVCDVVVIANTLLLIDNLITFYLKYEMLKSYV